MVNNFQYAAFIKTRLQNITCQHKQGSTFVNYGEGFAAVEGKPVYSVFSYKWAGLDPVTGDPQGYINGCAKQRLHRTYRS
jgi:hypothetical protein